MSKDTLRVRLLLIPYYDILHTQGTAFITQKAIDHFLTFESYEEVKIHG